MRRGLSMLDFPDRVNQFLDSWAEFGRLWYREIGVSCFDTEMRFGGEKFYGFLNGRTEVSAAFDNCWRIDAETSYSCGLWSIVRWYRIGTKRVSINDIDFENFDTRLAGWSDKPDVFSRSKCRRMLWENSRSHKGDNPQKILYLSHPTEYPSLDHNIISKNENHFESVLRLPNSVMSQSHPWYSPELPSPLNYWIKKYRERFVS